MIIVVEFKKWYCVFIYGNCCEFFGLFNGVVVVCFVEIIVIVVVVFYFFDLMCMFKYMILFRSLFKLEKVMIGKMIFRGMWLFSIV